MLGRNGLAWGLGLDAEHEAVKREGDGRSPAGIFELEKIYGREAEGPGRQFPYRALSETAEGVDDSRSRFYNRIVDRSEVTPDWSSSEILRPSNLMYRWLVNVKHNWSQRAGFGSCIYLHIWKTPEVATRGCTAMSEDSLRQLVEWLDAGRHPLLVQLTRDDYERVKQRWGLP